MSTDNFDIEKGFNEMFNSFEFEPSNSVWNNIETDLNNNFVENIFKDSFEGFEYQPKAASWDKIIANLWLYNFLRFSFKSFNIYYASAIIAFLIAIPSFLSSYNSKQTNKHNVKIISQNTINKENIENVKDKNILQNETKQNDNFINSKQNLPPEFVDTLKKDNNNTSSVITTTNKNINKTNVEIADADNNLSTKIITKYIKDTVFIRDTFKVIIRDTIYKQKEDEITKPKELSPWSADIYFSPMYSNPIISGSDAFANNISPDFNWSVGANINYSLKNINIQTGLSYTVLGEKFTYSEETETINKNVESRYIRVGEHTEINKYTVWQITDYQNIAELDTVDKRFEIVEHEYGNSIVIDTIWHYTIDTIYREIPIDSVETVRYDTIMVVEYDSVDVVVIDTTRQISFYDVVNRYSYIEIPLIVSYEFKTKGKVSYVLGGGLITGIFVNAKGKGVTLSNEIVSLDKLPFMKLNLTGILSAGIHYNITGETSLLFEGIYRRNFNSIYENNYFLRQKYNTFGLRLGLRFKF